MEEALEYMYEYAKEALKEHNIKALIAIEYCFNIVAIIEEIDIRLWLHLDYDINEWRVELLPRKEYYKSITR